MSTAGGLEVEGELRLDLGSRTAARVRADDRRLLVDFDDLRSMSALRPHLPRGPRRAAGLNLLRAILARSGLVFEAHLRGRPFAQLSGTSRSSWLARLLGLPGFEVSLPRLLLATLVPGRAR